MEFLSKYRILAWALVILAVMNLMALLAFYLYLNNTRPVSCEPMHPRAGRAFQDQLGLTEDQSGRVLAINTAYYAQTEPLVDEIRKVRSGILDELSTDRPDTVLIAERAQRISELQAALQKANFQQFLELKEVCTPEQAQRLSALYRELYGCGVAGAGGEQHKRRYRYGGQ